MAYTPYSNLRTPGAPVTATANNGAAQALAQSFAPPTDPNIGKPTSFWARFAQDGASAISKLESFAKQTVVSTAKTGAQFANQAYQGGKQVVDTAKLATAAGKKNPTAFRNANQQTQKDYQGFKGKGGIGNAGTLTTKQETQKGTAKGAEKIAGATVELGSLIAPGGGKAIEQGGALLLRKVGQQGVQELAAKAGIQTAKLGVDDLAKAVAKSSVGKSTIREIAKASGDTALKRAASSSVKGAAAFGAYSVGASAAQGGSAKQVLKSGAEGAVQGAALGAGGSLVGSFARRYSNKVDAGEVKAMQSRESGRLATERMANTRGLPTGEIKNTKLLTTGFQSKALPEGEKVPVASRSTATVPGKPATPKTIPLEKGEYAQRFQKISNSYDKSVKTVEKNTSLTSSQQKISLNKVEQDHKALLDQLDHEAEHGKASPSYTEGTPAKTVDTGFVKQTEKTSATAQVANKRISQLDTLISAAQKNGTTKSATEMRSLMRERQGLLDVAAGKKSVEDIKGSVKEPMTIQKLTDAANKDSKTAEISTQPSRPVEGVKASRSGLGQSGAVNPGAVGEDITKARAAVEAHLAQNRKATTFSGNVEHDAQIHEAVSKQRMADSAKLLENLQGVSKDDKEAVWNYREAKAAGTEPPKLTDNQKALHETISEITKSANENKAKLVEMKAPGYSKDKIYDPESGNHRIALGKGSAMERFMKGNQKTPLSARSLRTTTASSKARVYHAVTDSEGNRNVVVVKNRSVQQGLSKVSKGKFATMVGENGQRTELGKITPQEVKDGSFVGKDGKTYKISQATTGEITRATGQQYMKDPLTSAVIDYHETATALDSAHMIDKWKSSPDFQNIAMKHGEGVPPKNWKTTRLPQMQGYSFEPKVAEVLDDIYGNIRDKVQAVSLVNHALRNMMVAVPVRHNLNEIGFYFTDRGLSSLINPMAYKRGTAALIKATSEVMNQGPLYREVVSRGFNFMGQDDNAFADAVTKQTKSMLFDDQASAEKVATDMGTTVTKLRQAWNAVQHKSVWLQQDVLNLARIIERTDKGASLDDAVSRTARFNPQYRVPARVGNNRAASQVLRNNNLLFFGSYHYDQWKTITHMVTDVAGKNGGKAALEAADKFGAIALGVWATHALIDKGLQNFSGNNSAYTKPFGVLDLPDQLYQMSTGQRDIGAVLQSQIFPSAGLSTVAQMFENRDFFTGKQIRDTNMPKGDQLKQIGQWVNSQMPWSQQINSAKSGGTIGTAAIGGALGAHFPKNSPAVNTLNSLKYDTLPNIQTQAKKQVQAGNTSGAEQTISQYDKLLMAATKQALKDANKPIPSDQTLVTQLKKQQYYYAPKETTIAKWKSERPKSVLSGL